MSNNQTIEAMWLSACMSARSPSGIAAAQSCQKDSTVAAQTLLEEAGPCEQQDQADSMIDLAIVLSNDANMIKLAQIFVQQPRETINDLSVSYCQQAPRHAELNGLFQCQFANANPNIFSTTSGAAIAVGGNGTIPFGHRRPISTAGSCPLHPSGPIPRGSQLVDIILNNATTTSSTTSPSAPTISSKSSPSDRNSIPVSKAVIGIIVVVILLLTAVVLFCIWYVRRRRASASPEQGESGTIITPFHSDDKDLTLSLSSRAFIPRRDVDAGPAIEHLQTEPYGLLPPNYDHVFNRPEDMSPLVAFRRTPD